MMKIIITGGKGDLGASLEKAFPKALAFGRKEMDVANPNMVMSKILEEKPQLLIHAAALVGIRECEENKELAWKTNVEGTQNIVDALNKLDNGCHLIYISTACVFAGENEKYYTEDDIPSPKNFYSLTKL